MDYKVDETDLNIINVLKENADYSVRRIAKKTLLPATTIHRRIQKLKEEGIIKKFTVDLDYKKLNKGLLVYVLISVDIPLLKQNKKNQRDLVKEIKKFDFVERADVVSGKEDIVIMVRAKDIAEFEKFLIENIQPILGVEKTDELIVFYEE
jgi:DNA-binding Lrp family transcriptional regulator